MTTAADVLRELPRLEALLRGADFPCGADRWVNAHDLLLRFADQGRLPARRADLRPYLAPLFCRAPEDFPRFDTIFAAWAEPETAPGSVREQATRHERATSRAAARIPRMLRWPWLLAAGIASAAALTAVIVTNWPPPVDPVPPEPPETSPPATPAPPPELDTGYLDLALQPVPVRTPPEGPALLGRETVILAKIGKWLPWLPIPFALAVLAWHWQRRRIVLRRRRDQGDDPLGTLGLCGVEGDLFDEPDIGDAMRRLHATNPSVGRRLDGAATARRTARRGIFSPVRITRRSTPEVVILIDDHHYARSAAALGALVAQRLEARGLAVCAYRFRNEPRVLYPVAQAPRPTAIEAVAARHAGARVLVVGDPGALFDRWRDALAPWVQAFGDWPERAWLATERTADARLAALDRAGFVVAPLTGDGLRIVFNRLTRAPEGAAPRPPPEPPSQLTETERWTYPLAPTVAEQHELLGAVDAYVGRRGATLLGAMAAYPALHWGLTRALEVSLHADSPGRESRLLRIARLPWSRIGWMPDWLREALLRRLDRRQRDRIADIYRQLFATVATGGARAIELPIATPPPARTLWQRWRERVRRGSLLDYLRELLEAASPVSASGNPIFAHLVLGGRLEALDFDIDRLLARYLPGFRWASATRMVLFTGLLAAAFAWLLAAAWQTWGEDAVRDRLLGARVEFAGVTISVVATTDQQANAAAVAERLRAHGLAVAGVETWPTDANGQPAGGPPADAMQAGAGVGSDVAQYVAARLAYLYYATDASAFAPVVVAGSAIEATALRIWLRAGPGPTREGGFRDPMRDALTAEQAARFAGAFVPEAVSAMPVVFRDPFVKGTGLGPEMTRIPAGTFRMGCANDSSLCADDERPVRTVTVPAFAIGRYEVTFDEYDTFARATGRKPPDDSGWGRGTRPVVNVNWDDARAYAGWLGETTGQAYRLPSEAEWEYAARAGSETDFPWGDDIGENRANCRDCGSEWSTKQTAPVGAFEPNAFGLHDTVGNVLEWTEDCWHDSFAGAPGDGTAWLESAGGDCARRVVRGGGWNGYAVDARSAARGRDVTGGASDHLGFRVARTISP